METYLTSVDLIEQHLWKSLFYFSQVKGFFMLWWKQKIYIAKQTLKVPITGQFIQFTVMS